ncbi:MAG: hypothetical protein WC560_00110 [Syntrophales bacterium]
MVGLRALFVKKLFDASGFDVSLPKSWGRVWTDRAVFFGLLIQTWQVFVGPVTVLLIARCLTRETQGYYFLFGSILGFQVFLEMGFSTTLVYICSHEWAHLQFDTAGRVIGDPKALARLVSLGRLVFKWYAVASCFFVTGIGLGGYLFLNSSSHYNIHWENPWLAVVVVTGMLFWTAPFIAMLEGCNQIAVTNRFRLFQAILTTFVLWLILFFGGGLWALLASACSRLACNVYLFFIRYGRFFELFWKFSNGHKISWKNEVWPLQWRTGISQIVSYFAGNLFTPVIFHYHGAAIAGQMGMTWSLLGMLQLAALVWITTRSPRFGMLIARKEYAELDRLFVITCIASMVTFFIGAFIFWGVISILYNMGYPIASRFLLPFPTALLLIAVMLLTLATCESIYLHAHKRMPIAVLLPPVIINLGSGCTVWILGSRFGVTGAASGYLGIMIVFVIVQTIVWKRCRNKWHKEEIA